ncbi:Uncharacterised protein [Chlamydia trachomatis]|nr:Uncharacterised protein [Chlamydia trachomatis]
MILQTVGLEEGDGSCCVEIVLVARRLLRLRLEHELSFETDFLGVVNAHLEHCCDVVLLALEVSVPQVLVTFATAPEHVVLCAQALGDF